MKDSTHVISVTANGTKHTCEVSGRYLLADFIRHKLRLTGTHVGCAHGACGACTVMVDGRPMRSCLLLAVQANGATICTVEGLAEEDALTPLQEEFRRNHALQCGFCTPGMLISATALLKENPDPSEEEIREYMAGNLCRCTGYAGIVAAIKAAAQTHLRGR
ncbi:(2Fe-2S)-binding protein [Rhizobium lusitanum]|uniref:(2Fe-2S)-binding protein n=1 Tax=Rhizobium lusitanum TaxID=293958 RepID=UPI0015734BB6|nr:(2Fe-2S)-binding protein [Rhizobium lusitanum]NTJ11573.1 (2Fe-2S)-binding protein [Rhizobium lusitanum]